MAAIFFTRSDNLVVFIDEDQHIFHSEKYIYKLFLWIKNLFEWRCGRMFQWSDLNGLIKAAINSSNPSRLQRKCGIKSFPIDPSWRSKKLHLSMYHYTSQSHIATFRMEVPSKMVKTIKIWFVAGIKVLPATLVKLNNRGSFEVELVTSCKLPLRPTWSKWNLYKNSLLWSLLVQRPTLRNVDMDRLGALPRELTFLNISKTEQNDMTMNCNY